MCRHSGNFKIKASKPKATVVHVDIKWLFYSQVDEGALMCLQLRTLKIQNASGQKIQISSAMGELCCPRFIITPASLTVTAFGDKVFAGGTKLK